MDRVEIEEGEIPPHMEDHVAAMRHEFNIQMQQMMQQFASQQAAQQALLQQVQQENQAFRNQFTQDFQRAQASVIEEQIRNQQAASQLRAESERIQRDIQQERSRALSRVQAESQSSSQRRTPSPLSRQHAADASNRVPYIGVDVGPDISTFYKVVNKALKQFDGGEGWVMWRHNFMLHAKACNFEDFLLGSFAPPRATAPTTVQSEFKRYSFSVFAALNRVVTSILQQSLCTFTTSEEPAAKAWSYLCTTYDTKDTTTKMQLLHQLTTLRMTEGKAREFINAAKSLRDQLLSAGMIIPEALLITYLIQGLPDSWSSIQEQMKYKTDGELSETYVETMILRVERDRNLQALKEKEKSVLHPTWIATAQPQQKQQSSKKQSNASKASTSGKQAAPGASSSSKPNNTHCDYCIFKFKKERRHSWIDCHNRPVGWRPEAETSSRPVSQAKVAIPMVVETTSGTSTAAESVSAPVVIGHAFSTVTKLHMPTDVWVLDSGCTQHMTSNVNLFHNLKSLPQRHYVALGDNSTIEAKGKGDVYLLGFNNQVVLLTDVLYVPAVAASLLSVVRLLKRGAQFKSHGTCIGIYSSRGELIVDATVHSSDLLTLSFSIPSREHRTKLKDLHAQPATKGDTSSLLQARVHQGVMVDGDTWHRRLSHVNSTYLEKMQKHDMVNGLQVDIKPHHSIRLSPCDNCARGKLVQQPYYTVEHFQIHEKLFLVHGDICGPLPPSRDGHRYFLTLTDDGTRFSWSFALSTRDQVAEVIFKWLPQAQREAERHLKALRTDNAGEFISKTFQHRLQELGISQQFSLPYRHQQNGVAERLNRTLKDAIRTCLLDADLSTDWWEYALRHVTWVKNRTYCSALSSPITPYQAWFEKKPNISMLRVFGCMAIYHIAAEKRRGWDSPGEWGVFLGMAPRMKGWLFYNPLTRAITASNNAVFRENLTLNRWQFLRKHRPETLDSPITIPAPLSTFPPPDAGDIDNEDIPESLSLHDTTPFPPSSIPTSPSSPLEPSSSSSHDHNADSPTGLDVIFKNLQSAVVLSHGGEKEDNVTNTQQAPTTSCFIAAVLRHDNESISLDLAAEQLSHFCNAAASLPPEPRTIDEALKGPYAAEWKKALDEEFNTLMERDTWELVELPPGKQVVGVKWILRIKTKGDGSLERFKARLVARGFTQVPGEDFYDTYAPVGDYTTARMLLSVAAVQDMELLQLDVKNAFLYGNIDADIYMQQPPGYHDGTTRVCHLLRSLYGLKQSPLMWYRKLYEAFVSIGFKASIHDECLFTYKKGGVTVWALVYVDDVLMASSSMEALNAVVADLQRCFNLKVMPEVSLYLGMNIQRDREQRTISIGLQKFADKVMDNFDLQPRRYKTPLSFDAFQTGTDRECLHTTFEYLSRIGTLQYAATTCRPDLQYAASRLAQASAKPSQADWEQLERALIYFISTSSSMLVFGGASANLQLKAHVDSAYGSGPGEGNHRSTYGWVFQLGGAAISWCSKKLNVTTLSTAESEYLSLKEAGIRGVYLRELMEVFDHAVHSPTPLLCDSKAAVEVANNKKRSKRLQHITHAVHWMKEKVAARVFEVQHVPAAKQAADFLTKVTTAAVFQRCAQDVGLRGKTTLEDKKQQT